MAEQLRLSQGLDLVHVPFNSGGLAIGSAVAGHTPISFGGVPPAAPVGQEGKLRAPARSGQNPPPAPARLANLAAGGLPGLKKGARKGGGGPAGTAPGI